MNSRGVFLGIFLITAVAAPRSIWAGAGQTSSCDRELSFAHVCEGGMRGGLACQVTGPGCNPTTVDCPGGACVLDYTTPKSFAVEVTLIFDKNTSTYAAPETSLGSGLTMLLCVQKGGTHCLTQTYRPGMECGGSADFVRMGNVFGCVQESQIGGFSTNKNTILNNWRYFSPEGRNADGGFVQELRDLLEVTGIPVVTDIVKSSGGEDHNGDSTGSVARFKAKIRFVSGFD
jgi:hypothetical protein